MSAENGYVTGIRKLLNKLVQQTTDDGKIDFESAAFRDLEAELIKKDDECIQIITETLLETLKRSGCVDRQLILQLFDRFFISSVRFRDIILNDPQDFLELTVETNPIRNPLPGSKTARENLKFNAIQVIKKWENYFKTDARMKCIVITLKKTKFVEYDKKIVDFELEAIRKEKIEQRKQIMLKNTLTAYKSKFLEIKKVTDKLMTELESALNLLVPLFTDEIDVNVPSTSTKTSLSVTTIEVHIPDLIPEVVVSPDNEALVESFLDAKLLLIHRVQTLRKLVKRLQILKNYGEDLAQTIIVYRDKLKSVVLKAEELKIKGNPKVRKAEKRKRKFDDDFIDVEMSLDDILMIQYSKKAEDEKSQKEKALEEVNEKADKQTDKKKEQKIVTVPFGLDLKYWGEEREKVQIPKNNSDCHRFWRSGDEETSSGTVQPNIYTQRQFTFIGETPKSDKVCRAKLPNGSLCPRRDFHRCPLHGSIVERDDKGNPITEKDRRADVLREERKRKKEAEEYSKMIEKQYGKKKKKKYNVETTHSEDVRSRLQRKLLDPKTVARVSAVLDASRKNRLQNNFGHQFSHL